MTTTAGRLGAFLLIVIGIFAYLKVGVQIFSQVRNSGLRIEIKGIDRAIYGDLLSGGKVPQDLQDFLKKNSSSKIKKARKDSWGQDYYFEKQGRNYLIASSGADKVFGSEDDVSLFRRGGVAEMSYGAFNPTYEKTAQFGFKKEHSKSLPPLDELASVREILEALVDPARLGRTDSPWSSEEREDKILESLRAQPWEVQK